jgi:hypothetical protein
MQIDESDEQHRNADSSIDESLAPDSNVTVERDSHSLKHQLLSCSTEEGMQIDESDEQKRNADSAIDESREPDSNVTVERDLPSEKQALPSCSTEEGMQMVFGVWLFPFVAKAFRSATSTRTPSTET